MKFKANRIGVFYFSNTFDIRLEDIVIVDGDRGLDLGMVSKLNVTQAEMRSLVVRLFEEKAHKYTIPMKYIHRLATRDEIVALEMKIGDEEKAKQVCEMFVLEHGLEMAIIDVEYQWYLC